MTVEETPDRKAVRRPWLRFSLRTLMLAVMLVAAYCGGWVSHRAWNQRNVEQVVSEAMRQIVEGPVEIETVQGGMLMRGNPNDIQQVQESIERIDEAARE